MAVKAHRLIIEPTSIRGERGQYYRVYFQDAVLIEVTWNPEFEACRALVARGVAGRLDVWRAGKTHPDVIVPDIEEGARWTVVENAREGPVIKRWEPFPEHLQPDVPQQGIVASGRFRPRGYGDPPPTLAGENSSLPRTSYELSHTTPEVEGVGGGVARRRAVASNFTTVFPTSLFMVWIITLQSCSKNTHGSPIEGHVQVSMVAYLTRQ